MHYRTSLLEGDAASPPGARKRAPPSPSRGGMESVALLYSRHDSLLPRRDCVRGLTSSSLSLRIKCARGWRAEKRKPYSVRIRCRMRRAPSGAPHALFLVRYRASRYLSACSRRALQAHAHFAAIFAPHTGPRFCRECPAAAPSARWGKPLRTRCRERRSAAFDIGLTVISQLLAGLRIEPGRSPDAARVPGRKPDPRAPRPVPLPQRLATAPFERTRWGECNGGLRCGDKAVDGGIIPPCEGRAVALRPSRSAKSVSATGGG